MLKKILETLKNIYQRDIYENIVTKVIDTDLTNFDCDYEINKEYKKDIFKECDINSVKIIEDFSYQTMRS